MNSDELSNWNFEDYQGKEDVLEALKDLVIKRDDWVGRSVWYDVHGTKYNEDEVSEIYCKNKSCLDFSNQEIRHLET